MKSNLVIGLNYRGHIFLIPTILFEDCPGIQKLVQLLSPQVLRHKVNTHFLVKQLYSAEYSAPERFSYFIVFEKNYVPKMMAFVANYLDLDAVDTKWLRNSLG